MKKTILLAILCSFCSIAQSQWVSNYSVNGNGDNLFTSSKGLADVVDVFGNCIVTGYCRSDYNGDDIITIKYSSHGDTLWMQTYNGSGNSEDRAFAIVSDALGNIYVTGYAAVSGEGSNIVLIKYDANGNQQWVVSYNGSGNSDDKAFGITTDNLGGILITGYCTSNVNDTDIVTLKCSASGSILWSSVYGGTSGLTDKAFGIVSDVLNNVYITGYSASLNNSNDVITIKYSSSGQQLWAVTYDKNHRDDEATCIAVDALGNVYVAGFVTPGDNNIDCYLVKYSSLGLKLWDKTYNDGGTGSEDKAFGIVVDGVTGSIYIAGESGLSSNTDYVTIKYSSSGTKIWAEAYNGTGNGDDQATSIDLLPSGDVVITGKTIGTTSNDDYTTIKYDDVTGTQMQASTYSMTPSSEDIPTDVAVSDITGDVFVTGYSELLINGAFSSSYISTQNIKMGEKTEINTLNNIPSNYNLYQNYPNPFNPTTVIKFDVIKASKVRLTIYDMLGREVKTLVNGYMNAGTYDVVFTSTSVASGIYFYVLDADGFKDMKKMTLVK